MDDAGRTTPAALITAPSGPEVDPDGESADAVIDNGTMSSSRGRTGSSRSGADDRAGANGKPASDSAAKAENAAGNGTDSSVPLPADTVGKSSAGTSGKPSAGTPGKPKAAAADTADDGNEQGVRKSMTSGNGTWFAGRTQTAPSPDEAEKDSSVPAAKDDRKPSFTPASPAPTSPAASSSAAPSSAAAASSASSPDGSGATAARPGATSGQQSPGYSGTSSHSGTSYAPTASSSSSSGYQGSGSPWQASRDATMTAKSAPSVPPVPSPGSAPSTGPSTGGFAAATSAASAATSAVTGVAAGLASSVSSAWQNRGSNDAKQKPKQKPTVKGRKPAKRQAMLTLARLEPWSVMKFSFLASVVAFIILFVAVAVLYMVLSSLGAFDSIQHFVTTITSAKNQSGTNISHWFSASLILGYTAMLGAVNIVLITAMSTVGSVIYNLIAKTVGGVEVTLRETE